MYYVLPMQLMCEEYGPMSANERERREKKKEIEGCNVHSALREKKGGAI